MTTNPGTFLEVVNATSMIRGDADRNAMERALPWITSELDEYQIALVPFQTDLSTECQTQLDGRLLLLPFTWKELVQRVRTEVDCANPQAGTRVRFGDAILDLRSMEAWRSDRHVTLTAMEFKVLSFFVLNPNRVISRDEFLNRVWGYHRYPCTRTVDNHVLRLRQKFEPDMANPVHFRTVHSVGYKFTP